MFLPNKFYMSFNDEGGFTADIHEETSCRVMELHGHENITVNISMSKPFLLDGEIIDYVGVMSRTLEVKIYCHQNTPENKMFFYDKMCRLFRAGKTGVLTLEWLTERKKIDYIVSEAIFDQVEICNDYFINVKLLCPYPYFRLTEPANYELTDVTPLKQFPDLSPQTGNYFTAFARSTNAKTFTNTGNVPTGFKTTIECNDIVTDITIFKNENEYITIQGSFKKGDIITGSTIDRDIYWRLNGVNIQNRLSEDSKLNMKLEPGESIIGYTAEVGTLQMKIIIEFEVLYTYA